MTQFLRRVVVNVSRIFGCVIDKRQFRKEYNMNQRKSKRECGEM